MFRIDASGEWRHGQCVRDHDDPLTLAIDRNNRFLYVAHANDKITAYEINSKGELTRRNQQPVGGETVAAMRIVPSGRFILAAIYCRGAGVAVIPIAPDGRLDARTQFIHMAGDTGPHPIKQTHSHPHDIQFDPSGRFAVIADRGLDGVFVFEFEERTGHLLPAEWPVVASRRGAGPRHFKFHPTSSHLYLVNELDSTITTFEWNGRIGKLTPVQTMSTVPASFTENNSPADIVISPAGHSLFVSNRGHDSIATFVIDPQNGHLRASDWIPSGGRRPRSFALDRAGSLLHVANETSCTIVSFRINQETGALSPTGNVVRVGSPTSIILAEGTDSSVATGTALRP